MTSDFDDFKERVKIGFALEELRRVNYRFYVEVGNPLPVVLRVREEFLKMLTRSFYPKEISNNLILFFEGNEAWHPLLDVYDEKYERCPLLKINDDTVIKRKDYLIGEFYYAYERYLVAMRKYKEKMDIERRENEIFEREIEKLKFTIIKGGKK